MERWNLVIFLRQPVMKLSCVVLVLAVFVCVRIQ
jgi:hypothetical protein